MTIAELLQQPNGMPIVGFSAKIKSAFGPDDVNTTYGVKKRINLVLFDQSGEMRATWWEPPVGITDSRALRGSVVQIAARQNQKNQLSGAQVKHGKDQAGNPRVEIGVTGDHLKIEGGAQQTQPAPAPHAAAPTAAQQPAAASSNGNGNGGYHVVTESELLGLLRRTAAMLTEVVPNCATENISSILSTVAIAATQGRLTIEQPGDDNPDNVPF